MLRKNILFAAIALLLWGGYLEARESRLPLKDIGRPDILYVGTPYDIVAQMLKMAAVKKEDVVYDLGCGDGRMVVLAAQKFGCRGKGFDIDPLEIKSAWDNVERNGVGNLVEISQDDIFKVDFSDADVLVLYLSEPIVAKLLPKIEKLKPGARLVLHNDSLAVREPDRVIKMTSLEDNDLHTLSLYTVPFKPAKTAGDSAGPR